MKDDANCVPVSGCDMSHKTETAFVMLVQKNGAFRELLLRIFSERGNMHVFSARNLRNARTQLGLHAGYIDLVIADDRIARSGKYRMMKQVLDDYENCQLIVTGRRSHETPRALTDYSSRVLVMPSPVDPSMVLVRARDRIRQRETSGIEFSQDELPV